MGFDFEERKTSLYADLFKLQETSNNTMKSQWRSPSSSYSSTCDSSSSGFASPFGSELGSSESEDGDFAAELSRQMAECMLHEDEEEEERNSVSESMAVETLKYVNRPTLDHANRTPCIKLKNQPAVGDKVRVSRGRIVVTGAELTRQMQTQKSEQNYVRCRDRDWRSGIGRKGHSGSGMRAVFLGGPGSRIGSSGTGVFLPQVTNDPVQPKKKSGLSTVLIPTRVLQALEHHFKTHSDCAGPPLTTAGSPHHASPRDELVRSKGQGNMHTKFQMEADELHILPQEWTY